MKFSDICHVYGPGQWHDDAIIAADTSALLKIKQAVDEALTNGTGECELFVNDGEGFTFAVLKVDNPETKEKLAIPYTDDFAASKNKDAIWPEQILYKDQIIEDVNQPSNLS